MDPSLVLSPVDFDFGLGAINTPITKTFRLTGSMDVGDEITGTIPAVAENDFYCDGYELNLTADGEYLDFDVTFQPTSVGDKTYTLVITTSAPEVVPDPLQMALTGHCGTATLNVSASDIDFGNVRPGDTKDITLTITNNAASNFIITGTVSGLADTFSFVSGSGAFSLGPGVHKDIVLRYTPVDYEINYGAVSIAHIGTSPSTPITVDVTGTGANTTKYLLPTIYNSPVGTIKVYLFVDSSIVDLTIPTAMTIISIGDITESIDIEAGIVDVANVDLTVAEDYSNYTIGGFWFSLITALSGTTEIEIMFTVMEGANETFLFRGKVYREGTTFDEYYLNTTSGTPTEAVRGCKIQLISSIDVTKSILTSDVIGEVMSHATTPVLNYSYCSFKSILASIIKLSYGDAYDETSLVNNSTDILLYDTGYSAYFQNTYLQMYTTLTSPVSLLGVFSTGANGWAQRYKTAYDLLALICKTFCVVPRYSFGDENGLISATWSNNKHRLILNSRGQQNATPTITIPANIIESQIQSNSPLQGKNIIVRDTFSTYPGQTSTTLKYYYADGESRLCDPPTNGEPPVNIEFDIDLVNDFNIRSSSGVESTAWETAIWYNVTTSPAKYIGVRYYKYSPGAIGENVLCDSVDIVAVGGTYITRYNNLTNAIASYLYYRLSQTRVQITRTYGGITAHNGASASQRWMQTLICHSIHDGVTARTFYASEVTKSIMSNTTTIVWVQE